mmetsp:Transcript_29143/g.82734  ORF Transcript_29143/g.82734 Transcript_29143/m.82734 type:complete len:203 (-) Transcript_29143:1114-1722(-)
MRARWRSAPRARRRTACKCGRRGPPSRHWGAPATLAWAPAASWGRRAGCARRSRPRRAAASTVSAPGRPRSATASRPAVPRAGSPLSSRATRRAHRAGGPPELSWRGARSASSHWTTPAEACRRAEATGPRCTYSSPAHGCGPSGCARRSATTRGSRRSAACRTMPRPRGWSGSCRRAPPATPLSSASRGRVHEAVAPPTSR